MRAPMYHSAGDEAAFLGWLKRIRAVNGVSSRGRDLHIQLRAGALPTDDLHELRSAFHRYGMDTSGLEELRRR